MTLVSTIVNDQVSDPASDPGEKLQLQSDYCYWTAAASKHCDNILPPPAAFTSST